MFLKVLTAFAISALTANISQNFTTSIPNSSLPKGEENVCQYASNKSNSRLVNDETWTIMMYMLDGGGLSVSNQIDEIVSVQNKPNNVNLIIETNCDYFNSSNNPQLFRYVMTSNGLAIDETISRTNMGLESTFSSFLEWGLDNYFADKIGIIFFDHGRAIRGVCFDDYGLYENNEDSLLVSETSHALASSLSARNISKLEFVGYDACLMQLQDVAEYNSHYFNYMIGSEGEELADTMWAYDEWLPLLYSNEDTVTILRGIADSMVDYYLNANIYEATTWEQHLSVLDLSYMGEYLQKFQEMSSEISLLEAAGYNYFMDVVNSLTLYGQWSSNPMPVYHGVGDCKDFLFQLKEKYYEETYTYSNMPVNRYLQIESKINAVLNMFPDEDDYVFDGESTTAESNGLINYFRASYDRNGIASRSHGLSIHVCYDEEQIYPYSETHFTNWYFLFHTEHTYYTAIPVTNYLHAKLCECGHYEIEPHNMVYFNGHGHTMLHCETCDFWVDIS